MAGTQTEFIQEVRALGSTLDLVVIAPHAMKVEAVGLGGLG